MRTSEHVSRSEAGGSERGLREVQGRAHSPSPSFSGSYGFEDDDDDEAEDEGYTRESGRGSVTERFAHEPTSMSAGSAMALQQKPKRTRQLTTPQQSAVLHALLAQSRFPTTAMREEVGRQIGLSARKVQVWFQNQRQKARKESKEAAAAAVVGSATRGSRPPQFGPFTNVPPGSSAALGLGLAESSSSGRPRMTSGRVGEPGTTITYERAPGPSFAHLTPASGYTHQEIAPSRRASDPSYDNYPASFRRSSGDDLTGPGVPGAGVAIDPFSQPSELPSTSSTLHHRPLSPQHSLRLPPVHTITPPLPPISRREGQTPSALVGYRHEHIEEHPSPRSLRLPPIQLGSRDDRHRSFDRGSDVMQIPSERSHTATSSQALYTTPIPPQSRTRVVGPGFPFGRVELPASSMTPPPLPPPSTLEPDPLWQPSSSEAARMRTQSGPVAYSTPSFGSSRQSGEASMIERRTLPPPTRTTRFDPVRNTEIPPPIQHPRRTHSRSPDDN